MAIYLPKIVLVVLLVAMALLGLVLGYASEYYASANYLRPNWAARAVYLGMVVGGFVGAVWLIFGG